MRAAPTRLRRRSPGPRRQRGLLLLLVLVLLSVMLLAGVGVMRSVDTGNVIAGNFAFQQAAVQASDRPVNDALNTLAGIVPSGGGNNPMANRYLNVRATAVDARGFPSSITWANVPCTTAEGVTITDCATDTGGYRVQYFIERRCTANPDLTVVADIRAKCEYEATSGALAASSVPVRYRVIIRVRGPRGTEGWFEAMVSGPAST
jgi:Tfp pilus assembly protein PilX